MLVQVVTAGGQTYEREAISEHWRRSRQATDPLTGVVLPTRDVITNFDKRRCVQGFLDKHPDYVPAEKGARQSDPVWYLGILYFWYI